MDKFSMAFKEAARSYSTIEPKLIRFENCHIYEGGEDLQSFANNCEILINAVDLRELVNRRTQPENKPLSLEELKNMDSEPAYLVDKDANIKRWVIIRAVREDFIICDNGNVISINDLHRDYDFYAHKPEQEEK